MQFNQPSTLAALFTGLVYSLSVGGLAIPIDIALRPVWVPPARRNLVDVLWREDNLVEARRQPHVGAKYRQSPVSRWNNDAGGKLWERLFSNTRIRQG